MFLSITDSVINSHILSRDFLLRVQVSVDVSLGWNTCLDVLNVVWNCHIYQTIVNKFFIQSIKCEK